MRLEISIKKLIKNSLFIIIFLVLIHLVLQYLRYETSLVNNWRIIDKFDLDQELNVPTWFNQILLLFSAVLLFFIYKAKKSLKDIYAKYWLSLSLIFVFLSIDEGAALHELLSLPTKRFLAIEESPGIWANAWVIPVSLSLLLLIIIYFKFFLSLSKKMRALLVLSLFVFVLGSVGMDIYVTYFDYGTFVFNGLIIAAEEGLEMLGITIFIFTLADHLKGLKFELPIKFIK